MNIKLFWMKLRKSSMHWRKPWMSFVQPKLVHFTLQNYLYIYVQCIILANIITVGFSYWVPFACIWLLCAENLHTEKCCSTDLCRLDTRRWISFNCHGFHIRWPLPCSYMYGLSAKLTYWNKQILIAISYETGRCRV